MLDTSVVVAMLQGEDATLVRTATLRAPVLLAAVSRAELEAGVVRTGNRVRARLELDKVLTVMSVVPFDDAAAATYGHILTTLGHSRQKTLDRMIAATALVAGATLATLNAADFRDVPGLHMEDWRLP